MMDGCSPGPGQQFELTKGDPVIRSIFPAPSWTSFGQSLIGPLLNGGSYGGETPSMIIMIIMSSQKVALGTLSDQRNAKLSALCEHESYNQD